MKLLYRLLGFTNTLRLLDFLDKYRGPILLAAALLLLMTIFILGGILL